MVENGLLINNITKIDEFLWAKALLGEDRDWDLTVNINTFATEWQLLHVDSLFKSSLGSMTGRVSQLRKDTCTFLAIDPSIIDLGLNVNNNITTTANNRREFSPDHLAKVWRIDVEAAKKLLEVTT